MGLEHPGSVAEYLEARREELEAEKEAAREKDDEARFIEEFVAAGGNRADALGARRKLQNEQALEATRRADEDALVQTRLHASRSL
jgi:ATPase subunit of ABC transporter with duplicated ATPase domains